ncbi:F-actin-monooxygenase Mical isoform X4 [Drosophila santomea]|uniref:F-actin-monooxygenase Mical isoform X4 n=1 Tax=Drosophila santomea TaxID=129105 RepID=UPI001953FE07|nr:F-actin-monooxygenase Mical isoform X4 [Drosophila santomea]
MCKFSFLVAVVVISKHPTNSMSTKPLSFRRMSRQHQRHHPQHHHLPPHQQPQQQMPQQQQQLTAQQQQQQQLLMAEHAAAAEAAELFDLLCVATTMRQILALHRAMCEAVGLRPSPLNDFYPRLKAKVRSWKAQALWKKFDARAAHRVYGKGAACTGTRVLVIGAGPCGLRTAIEAQLLGAKVVVLEKRDRITRNNVLHLWPFVITDLRNLGAKKFYGKFCAGSIDHISIRQLQCMLLKVALLLGVEIHEGVSFEHAVEPSGDGGGWRAAVTPSDHAVSHYEFDVLIGADGKRNMLDFRRKEFRGKLAIAITANFINKKTEAEAKVEEISGVAFIFNQAFFKELYGKTGIDLENIVYYKDETHYFVMTAKKHSLIDKGVIIEDMADPGELLAPANVDTQKLHDYAREAAEFSTQYQMPNLEFAVNHYGKPDVAMFDFTSMFAAEMSCRVIVRKGARLMQCLVGDSLLEPFWPTGSGCARGFLSSMDAAYAIKLWSNPQNSTLGVLAQRESIYRLLNQTTPDTLQRDISAYTVDPSTRYPNLNRESVNSWQVKHLVDTDDPSVLEQTFMDTHALQTPHLDTPGRRKRRSGDLMPQGATLLRWISAQLHSYQFIPELKEASDVFRNGRVLCALINRYRPDLIDYAATKDMNPVECNELAFAVLERELHIDRVMSAKQSLDLTELESRIWLNYLDQICDLFRGEIPHIKHPKMDFSDLRQKYRINHTHAQPDFSKLLATKPKAKSPMQDAVDIPTTVQRRSVLEEERAKRQRRHEQLLNIGGGAAGSAAGVAGSGTGTTTQGQSDTPRRSKKRRQVDKTANISSKVALAFKKQAASEKCRFCKQTVYLMEKTTVEGLVLHRNCLKCHHCHTNLRLGGYAFDRDDPQGRFYCTQHFRLPPKPLPQRTNKARKSAAAQPASPAVPPSAGSVPTAAATAEPMDTTPPRDQVDLLETSRANASADAMSDDEANVIDEHEWSGRNFLPESNNDSQSELSSSDESDTESDSEMFEEADDSPFGAQTLQLASDWIGKQYCEDSDDSDDFYDSSEGIADDGKDDTEGEEFKKARELRRQEVRLQPLPANLPTDTETEVQTESESTSPDEVELNSATEISTDSEFDNDEIIRQAPKIFIDDTHLRKPTKVQIKSTMIGPNAASAGLHQKQLAAREKGGSYLQKYQPQPPLPQFKPLVQVDPTLLIGSQRAPLQNPRPGDYLLNKTASTEGIASKKSLELKKRYLLGEPANGNKIQKSGSTSVLDSRIRSFQSNISECQKLLNPSSDISAGMRTFLDRTKLGEGSQTTGQTNELIRSATSNVINDLRVELRIQKTGSSHSTDNEKENVFVNCKNELNKGMEYTDAVNATLLDQLARKSSPTTPTNKTVVEVIDLVTPEKPMDIIDLTALETPKKQLVDGSAMDVDERLTPDSNKISELQQEVKEEPKPDVSRDVKECIPDILGHIKEGTGAKEPSGEDQQSLLEESDEEKRDSPEKDVAEHELYEPDSVQIQVPNIPWDKTKPEVMSTTGSSGSICSSSDSSSIEDIQHYILESTTSPDTQTVGGKHNVPRLEVHDTSGALMQVDSLMIVNGKYIGDPEDVKFLDMPANVIVPPAPALKTNELDMEDDQEVEAEPVTATPEPVECTVIETERRVGAPPPLPEMGPPKLKFDSKNENKIESLKNLPLIVESNVEHSQAVKPITLNLSNLARTPDTPTTPTAHDSDKTPTGEILSRGSDSETEHTGTGQVLTETELSDWTADDCISENFVDLEFVLNSNKGTIKRRKDRRRSGASKLPSGNEVIHELARQAPVVQMDGILSAIDIDDIEFMDTGSEGSCAEAYSATNTALIQNRGYMEYIESEPKKATRKAAPPSSYPGNLPPLMTKRDEKLGIDYIEQGAYIMHDDAKTPVNEVAPAMTQSLTDSSTLNELDDDSMIISQTQPTTTEESEALTVVTSPLDTSSPRVLDQFASMLAAGKGDSTPSSSEQQPKTSTVTSSSTGPNSSTPGNVSKEPLEEDLQIQFEYVRALQQRISQISTQRRKSSKGEAPNLQLNSSAPVIESAEDPPKPAEEPVVLMRPRTTSISGKVPEIPTLSSKLEEITKERTKQKDLIHDLVMDKLQSKKQLNAEKRLHRSRQRSLLTSGYASGSSLSPTPKLAAACSPQDSNCSSQAHYHASTAEEGPKPQAERPLQKSATSTYVSPYRTVQAPTRSGDLYKPRPFSEHINSNALAGYKLGKTASFNGGKLDDFAKPIAPARVNRGGGVVTADVANISASTENLRSEARARARLKSNTELGLSPEEKMQLIRSRLHYDQSRSLKPKQLEEMPSGDLAARARKMSASKSVNDLAYMVGQQQQQHVETDAVLQAKAADFTSDPNLASGVQEKTGKTKSGRRPKDPERRKSLIQSLSSFFQKGSASAASSAKEQGGTVAAGHSEQSERPGTSSSGTPTISDAAGGGGGGGGVFSRFRISPKSKEKSKSCFDLRNFGFGDKDMLVCSAASPAGATSQKNHSQDYLNTTNNSRYRKQTNTAKPKPESFSSSSPQLYIHKPHHLAAAHPSALDDQTPPPIPPLPLNYQRSDDESYANETREHKKQRAISKASRQAELKRLRIAQEIQREQEEIEVQLKDLEARGVLIEKALRGEAQNIENLDATKDNDEKLLKELLEIWRNITALKKRDEELTIRQQELQLEYRHAQLKEELNLRLSCNKLDKSSADVAAEGAILNEMLEIVAKRAALRPTASQLDLTAAGSASTSAEVTGIKLTGPHDHEESII